MTLPFPILTAEEAAEFIDHGSTIGFSGFTAAGSPKAIPRAVAAKARREHEAGKPFKVGVLTGASTGPSLDGALAEAEAISFRTPYQSCPTLRKQINSGQVRFVDKLCGTGSSVLFTGRLSKPVTSHQEAASYCQPPSAPQIRTCVWPARC